MQKQKSPTDFRHIDYTCMDNIERQFSPFSMADMKKFAPLLLALQNNDPWLVFLFGSFFEDGGETGGSPSPATKKNVDSPLSEMEYSSLVKFLTVAFSKKYCTSPLTKKQIPNAVDMNDIRQILAIATGVASRLKEEMLNQ